MDVALDVLNNVMIWAYFFLYIFYDIINVPLSYLPVISGFEAFNIIFLLIILAVLICVFVETIVVVTMTCVKVIRQVTSSDAGKGVDTLAL
jgi:hypothetical protein